jgi:CheY-like chemotaxis protein
MAYILVIDDDDELRETIRRILEPRGHVIEQAGDGTEGLARLEQRAADLVITDVFMPGRDGIETLIQLRKTFPQVKVIVMSGGDSTGLLNLLPDAELLGANWTLHKPFKRDELEQAVAHVLSQ